MKVIDHLKSAKKPFISFEILPPIKGRNIDHLYNILDELMEFKPPFINVTYHRAEYKYKKRADGLLEKVYTRKRPGTVGICAAIQNKYHVDAVPHLTCGGFTKEETEDALIDLALQQLGTSMSTLGGRDSDDYDDYIIDIALAKSHISHFIVPWLLIACAALV